MDKQSEKEKSSRRHKDSDRDRDHHHKHRSSKHKSRDDDDKQRSRDRESDRERRERSYESRDERERSRERVVDVNLSKRKERGGSEEERFDEKRVRVSEEKRERKRFEDVNGEEREERDERRERKRFEDGEERDERRERKRFEDEEEREKREGRDVRKERRRFGDKVKEEDVDVDGESKRGGVDEVSVKREVKNDEVNGIRTGPGGSAANGAGLEPLNMASGTLPEASFASGYNPKVSSIYTTNENKGVIVNRSYEVPGKSSTDGTTSAAGKSGGLHSLDALTKARITLQKQKEISEKLKKMPLLNRSVGSKEGSKAAVSSSGILPTPAPSAGVTISSTLPASSASVKPLVSGMPHLEGLTAPKVEAVKRAQELAAKMGFRQDPQYAPLINMFPGQLPPEVTLQPKPAKAPVLRLDALGREIDEHGNVVNVPKLNNLSTLKVNINKQKKDSFQILKPELEVDPEKNPHFDPDMGIDKNKLLRPKRMNFQFVEEGKWSRDAEITKLKSQFGEAQAKELKVKQAQLAKAKAEPDINPNLIEVSERVIVKEKPKEPIPDVEWWDAPLLLAGNYNDICDGKIAENKLRIEKITIYVEHPRPIEPPAEAARPPPQPLKLTKKEQKKLRTQRRLAREKDKQEMIRQGLIEPPKPKVKMSNLMKVLGSEATQDPTRLEMEIRSAAAEREQAHVDRNMARKLTPDERSGKKKRKLFDDPNTLETLVSVYRINDLSHPQTCFKVDVNAQENRLTGCAVISDGITVVVVEGGSKSIKRYKNLMLKRIDWAAAVKDVDEDEDEAVVNKCVKVWEGSVAKPSFNRFLVHKCRSEAAARKIFSDAGVPHYWDLAVSFTEE